MLTRLLTICGRMPCLPKHIPYQMSFEGAWSDSNRKNHHPTARQAIQSEEMLLLCRSYPEASWWESCVLRKAFRVMKVPMYVNIVHYFHLSLWYAVFVSEFPQSTLHKAANFVATAGDKWFLGLNPLSVKCHLSKKYKPVKHARFLLFAMTAVLLDGSS